MAGFENNVLVAKNINFDEAGSKPHLGIINAAGKLPIGTGNSQPTPEILAGSITSPLGTLSIGYSSPNITIDITGGATAIEKINVDNASGTGTNPVVPTSGTITMTGGQYAAGSFGTRVIDIASSAVNTVNILLQQSSAVSSTNSAKNGIAHFNSGDFSVDSSGFVSIISGGFTWTDVTTATQTLVAENGYVTDRGGGVTYTLPASGTLGDQIRIVGKLGLTTIAQNANQQIVFGSSSSTVGVGGSVAGTNVGDCMTLICITAGASTVWRISDAVGNLTVT